jgi:hypothetical protein
MPSDRSKKHLERIALALKIERSSFSEEMSPCDFCVRTKRRCIAAGTDSARCSECIRHGRSGCNFKQKLPSLNDWASIDRQRKKLREEQDEAMSKILRLRQMEKALDERERKMIEMGVKTLDELDRIEAEEKAIAERHEAEARNLGDAVLFLENPGLDPEAFANLPDAFWTGISSSSEATNVPSLGSPGFLTGTAEVDPGS